MSTVRLTRRVSFSSGHRYWRADQSEAKNLDLFGPWASPFNHGHNYVLDVGCDGTVDPRHGMVVNIKVIDDILQTRIVQDFDQRSINDQVPFFADRAPSVENLLLYFRDLLRDLPSQARLAALRLEETPLLYGEWHADLKNLVNLTRIYEFAASHRLHAPNLSSEENIQLFGKCNNPTGHGHNYVLEVTVQGEPDPESGMMVDLAALDAVVHREVVDRYDHHNLSVDFPEFEGKNATSEIVAQEIFQRLVGKTPIKLARIRLHETARNIFEVRA